MKCFLRSRIFKKKKPSSLWPSRTGFGHLCYNLLILVSKGARSEDETLTRSEASIVLDG